MRYHRRPSVSYAYVPTGTDASHATQAAGCDTVRRIAGCLDVRTGQFHSQQKSHWTVPALLRFFRAVDAAYPHATRLSIALDNWHVHILPTLRDPLAATTKIRLPQLPTYAPGPIRLSGSGASSPPRSCTCIAMPCLTTGAVW